MKVKELIEKLKEVPQDFEVTTEGCDCDGEIVTVTTRNDDVYLRRK